MMRREKGHLKWPWAGRGKRAEGRRCLLYVLSVDIREEVRITDSQGRKGRTEGLALRSGT